MGASTADDVATISIGDLIADRYVVERELGSGAFSTVFLCDDVRCGRRVAIKVLLPSMATPSALARFRHEVATLGNLQHPNLMPLFDSGDVDSLPFYVMPYVEGETLRQRLLREQQLPIAEALRLTIATARALHCAHRHGVVHRDVKPENILLRDGQVIIADFGIAFSLGDRTSPRLTQAGAAIGTPLYMSPEQAAGDDDVDHRTDVYSLGVVLYEMLCGEPPHTGPNSRAVIAHILTRTASPASALRRTISHGLDSALARALEKEPDNRFATAADFADALAAV